VSFQFVHVQTYSIKTGGAGVAAEAGRKPENSRHVENPLPPVLLAGVEPELAWSEIERRHSVARDTYTTKTGKTTQRRLRSDAAVLLAAVASHPEPTETADTDSADFRDWLKRSIEFFTEQHGEPLSVVMHLDESHPHIHFLTAPNLENGQRMPDIHAGEKAKANIGGKHAKKRDKKQAFTVAMRGYQDRYQEMVGVYHGQARLGPKRQRLDRTGWMAQQAEAARQAERLRQLESQTEAITTERAQLEQDAAQALAQVTEAKTELSAREDAVSGAQNEVRGARNNLKTKMAKFKSAKIELADRVSIVTAREKRLGGFWGAFVGMVTFGKAGTKRSVQDAVLAVNADFAGKLAKASAEAGKAAQEHESAAQRLNSENRLLTEQNMTLTGAANAAEKAQRQAQAKAAELAEKMGPIEVANEELIAVRDRLAGLVDDVEAAVNAGDLALAKDLLNPDKNGPELRV
jgi:hypothetical protein